MTVLLLSLILALAGCTGLILAGRGHWQGWAVGLAVQPVWAVFAIVTRGYGLLLTCLMYGTVYTRNLLAWRRRTAPSVCRHESFTVPATVGRWNPQCSQCHLTQPAEVVVYSAVGSNVAMDDGQRDAWLSGYEWALAHLDDEGVASDRRRLEGAAS